MRERESLYKIQQGITWNLLGSGNLCFIKFEPRGLFVIYYMSVLLLGADDIPVDEEILSPLQRGEELVTALINKQSRTTLHTIFRIHQD